MSRRRNQLVCPVCNGRLGVIFHDHRHIEAVIDSGDKCIVDSDEEESYTDVYCISSPGHEIPVDLRNTCTNLFIESGTL